ncbi:MAG TPA: hypothetical protein VNO21_10435, partial [Polyangiaceae bacterium]|nr:hypothetical protein [Polyangiaceae bacterium]
DRTAPAIFKLSPDLAPGAAHASEVGYLFDYVLPGGPVYTSTQRELGSRMIGIWTTLARTGDPGTPKWSPAAREAVVFGGPAPTWNPWAEHHCDLWRDFIP